jgi:hypothetical protein
LRVKHFALLLLAGLPLWFASTTVQADAQMSARGALGFGKRKTDVGDEFVSALSVRADALVGAPRHGSFRFGYTIEGRTTDFWTLEGAGGLMLLVPMPFDLSLGLSGLIGLAHRREAPDGWMAIGTASLGYRGYNYHGWYGYGINLFFSGRKLFGDDKLVEFTGGVELDLLFVTVIPYLAIKNWLNKGDPHEP